MSDGRSANSFFEALKVRRNLVLHIFLGVMLIVAAAAYLTLQYSASALVALDPHALLDVGAGRMESPVDLAWTVLTDKQIQAIVQQFQLNSGLTRLRAQNQLFTYVRSNISFREIDSGESGTPATLQVSFVGYGPSTVINVANAIAHSLAQPIATQPIATQPIAAQPSAAAKQQTIPATASPKDLAEELDKVRTTLQLLSQTKNAPMPKDELQKHFKTDADLQAARRATVVELAALDEQASQAAAAASKARALAMAQAMAPPPPNPAAVALEQQIKQVQANLAQLRQRYTDEYPEVEGARETLAELESKLNRIPVEKPRPRPVVQASGPTPEEIRITAVRNQLLERQQGLDEAIKVNQNQAELLRQRSANSKDFDQDYAFEQQRYEALLKQQQAEANGPVSGTNGVVSGTNGVVSGTNGPVSGTNGPVSGTNGVVSGTNGPVGGAALPRFIVIQSATSASANGIALNPLFWIFGLLSALFIASFSAFVAEQFNPADENDPTPRSLHINN